MLRTLLHFRNFDSTQDLNDQLSGFFKRGIIAGGDVVPVPGILAVDITPFKLIGQDGMVVLETSVVNRLIVSANRTNVIVYKSHYIPNADAIVGFEVLEYSAYQARLDIAYLTVFAIITLGVGATEVFSYEIDYTHRDILDPVQRLIIRASITSPVDLPSFNNRPGDGYLITNGAGDTPELHVWNGTDWINITDSLTIASILNAHRNNLYPNEIHLTNAQALAVLGTYGTPGSLMLSPLSINIGTGVITLPSAPNPVLAVAQPIQFSTTGALPTGLVAGVIYYAIPLSPLTFKVAITASNAALAIAIPLFGVQSGVHTLTITGNQYVTSSDPRVPTVDESAALAGIPGIPSVNNPYVTSTFSIAEPSSTTFLSGATSLTLTLNDGPIFVGLGTIASVLQYIRLYHTTASREFVNLDGGAITITGVFKDALHTQPLFPAIEAAVVIDKGFYSGVLYLTISGPVSQSGRIVYGKRKQLWDIPTPTDSLNKGAMLLPQPSAAEISQELLVRLKAISGRLFDDPMQIGESNVELKNSIGNVGQYFKQLRITPHLSDLTRIKISGSDSTSLDSVTVSQTLDNLFLKFTGCEIKFTGAGSVGTVYASDGTTVLLTFTAVIPVLGQFRYYSINLLPSVLDASNRLLIQVTVVAAAADDISLDVAPRALFIPGSIQLGQFAVQNNAGTVGLAQIYQSGVDFGEDSGESIPGTILQPADGFQAVMGDTFDTTLTLPPSGVRSETQAVYDLQNQMYALSCDKTKTVTTIGLAFTLSAFSTYMIAVGDIIYVSGTFRRIVSVVDQAHGTLDAAFTPNLTLASCMVSQAVWTQDLTNYEVAGSINPFTTVFSSANLSKINISYSDTLTAGNSLFDVEATALIACSASNSGLSTDVGLPTSNTFSPHFTRPMGVDQIPDYVLQMNTNSQRLFLVFFPNPDNVLVTGLANLIEYQCSLYEDNILYSSGVLNSSFCMTNGTGIPNNCYAPTIVGGVTRIKLGFPYVQQSNLGQVGADIDVWVAGQKIPRYYAGITGNYWKEVSGTVDTIDLWANLSASPFSVQVERRQGYNDRSVINGYRLSNLQEATVGSAAQVAVGAADFTKIKDAHDAVASGGRIFLLNQTFTEPAWTWSKSGITIEGKGYGSVLNGNLTMTASSCMALGFKVTGNITLTSSDNSFFRLWMGTGSTYVPGGGGNRVDIIAE